MSNLKTAHVESKDMTLSETVKSLQEHELKLRDEQARIATLAADLRTRAVMLDEFDDVLKADITNTMQLIAQLTANISALQTSP